MSFTSGVTIASLGTTQTLPIARASPAETAPRAAATGAWFAASCPPQAARAPTADCQRDRTSATPRPRSAPAGPAAVMLCHRSAPCSLRCEYTGACCASSGHSGSAPMSIASRLSVDRISPPAPASAARRRRQLARQRHDNRPAIARRTRRPDRTEKASHSRPRIANAHTYQVLATASANSDDQRSAFGRSNSKSL